MKILLDENMPLKFRQAIPGHEVFTVKYLGWNGLRNGRLLEAAEAEAFDVLITLDAGMEDSQNKAKLPISVLLLQPPKTDLESLVAMIPEILSSLGRIKPRMFMRIPEN